MRKPSPHCSLHTLTKLDRRTREAKLMKRVRDELTDHLGGRPSVTQRLLIERVAILIFRLDMLDRQMLDGVTMEEHTRRAYLAWHNSVSRSLRHLGLTGAPAKAPSLADYLANKQAEAA